MPRDQFEVVVLSSSPPAPDLYAAAASSRNGGSSTRRVAMPTSPPLTFSPSASPKRAIAGASKTNLRAAPTPDGAVRGFATVGSLMRSEHFANQLGDDFAEIQQAPSQRGSVEGTEQTVPATKKARKRPTKKLAADGSEKPRLKPRAQKPKADKDESTCDPEIRLPAPTKSPFFANENPQVPIESPNGPADAALKLTKSGKPRKPRVKKQKVDDGDTASEPKPKKTRVTKARGAAKSGKPQQEDASHVSAHFRDSADKGEESAADGVEIRRSTNDENIKDGDASIWEVPQSPRPKKKAPPKQRPPDPLAEGLDLDEAVLRRRDWTPPPEDTATQTPFTDSAGKENIHLARDAGGNFTYMLSNFAYAQSHPSPITAKAANSTAEVTVATKRRRVELVEVPSNQINSRDSSPEKGKAPKKKPRTITDLVTEQYAPKDPSPDPHAVTSDFFQSRTTTMKVPLNDASTLNASVPPKKLPRKRANSKPDAAEKAASKAKPKKASAKSTKPKPIAEKLLSPASALVRMNRQDILFGTSSQLALEESPTTLRQLQLAMKASEHDVDVLPDPLLPPPPRWQKLGKVQGKKSLWAASARDDEGGILEHMEDVYIPEPDRTQDIPLLMDGTHDEPDARPTIIHIDDIDAPPAVLISSDVPTPPRIAVQASQIIELGNDDYPKRDIAFEDIDNFEQEPPPSNQNAESQNSFAHIDDFSFLPSTQMRLSSPPKLRPPASATALAESSPKKRRGRPSKSQSPAPAVASPASILKSSTFKVKAKGKVSPRPSTPPKAPSRFIDIEEILDSEDEAREVLSPSPPRIRSFQDSQPLPLISLNLSPTKATSKSTSRSPTDASLTPIHLIPSSNLQWEHIKGQTFEKITAHIRSLPPTTNPKKPSWHEKILMYDPIVLEDFTAYLNTHTTIRTYKKATQKQIKAWNQGLKANGDATLSVGESGEEVLAIEKELEAYMVQGWCENLSVCCIWGEGRGKSGVRKGFY